MISKFNASKKMRLDSWTAKLLCLFLATDVTFIILYLLYEYTSLISNSYYSLQLDRSYSEIFQYIKEYWIALLLGFLGIQLRSFLLLIWSSLFFYLLLDDAAKIHETLGKAIGIKLGLTATFNLRPQDFGEFAVSALVGGVFLCLIAIAYRFSDRFSQEATKVLLLLLSGLALCGIVIDMLHVAFETPITDPLFILAEDGGELIIMSIAIYFAFVLLRRSQAFHSQE